MEKQNVPVKRLQRLLRWIDRRTGLDTILKVSLDEPIPGGANWAYIFGSGLLFLFISQVITGICLAVYYVPSAQSAHVSVAYITKQVAEGDFLRSLHYYGSSAMVIVLLLHFLQTFLYGAYKGRRELLWISGGTLALLVTGMAFTGYLLPWDQKAYYATAVGTNLISQVPFIGQWLEEFLRGGDTIGTLTLSRFYIAHVILIPACIFGVIAIHIYLFRKAGAAGPISEDPLHPKLPPESFYPRQVLMDMAFAMVLMSVLGLLAILHPVGLGPRADPSATNYLPRPEWYFLPFFEWLKYWEGPRTIFGVILIPAALALLFFTLPFLDRRLERRPWRRPIPLLAVSIVLLGVVYLGLLSRYQDMHQPSVRQQLALQAAQERAYDKSPFVPFMQASGAINLLQPATFNPTIARGKALFAQNGCAGCHGARGRGAIGPSLVGIGKKFNPPALMALIHHPTAAMHAAGMPDHFPLTDRNLQELVSYLDALGTPEENVQPLTTPLSASTGLPAPAAAAQMASAASVSALQAAPASKGALIEQGHQIFQAQACFACHGGMAQGTPRAPTLAGWAAKTPVALIRMHITQPTAAMQAKGMMPHNLPPDQLNALIVFLQ
ncbi:MAG: cytochrome b N-terminal domain-containing protein, partial [Terracidiphilus sp.]